MHRFSNFQIFTDPLHVCFGFCLNPLKFGWFWVWESQSWRCQLGLTLPGKELEHVPKGFLPVALFRHFEILNSFCGVLMSICTYNYIYIYIYTYNIYIYTYSQLPHFSRMEKTLNQSTHGVQKTHHQVAGVVFTIIFLSMYARLGAVLKIPKRVDGFESEGRSGSERTHIFGSGYIYIYLHTHMYE